MMRLSSITFKTTDPYDHAFGDALLEMCGWAIGYDFTGWPRVEMIYLDEEMRLTRPPKRVNSDPE